jgi:serine/threonine-protein kinase RsbW
MILLRVPGAIAYRDLAIRFVAGACHHVIHPRSLVDPGFDHHVVSAFGEAFNNVAHHAYADQPVGDLDVEVEFDRFRFTIRITHGGATFDLSTQPISDLGTISESALSVFILTSFMDEVRYRDGVPNVLTMTKRLRARSAPNAPGA